ncbi:MAG: universal stress protein [Deltaproteobacteria bacterium]|nr:universal stress protein [Deltaproteobacteria bacterium]
MKQILVATDFSEQSDSAIRHAVNIACSTEAALRIVHVVETPADEEGLESAQPAVQHWHIDDEARVASEVEACAAEGIDIAQEIVDAPSTAEGLQSVVDTHGADLTIVGSTGLSGASCQRIRANSHPDRFLRTCRESSTACRGAGSAERTVRPRSLLARS